MSADIELMQQQIAALLQRQQELEDRMFAWEHAQVDPASGGGQFFVSGKNVMVRLNSLTPEGAQMP